MVRSNIPDSEDKRVTAKASSAGQGVVRLEPSERGNLAAKSLPYAPALSEGYSVGGEAIIDATSASSRIFSPALAFKSLSIRPVGFRIRSSASGGNSAPRILSPLCNAYAKAKWQIRKTRNDPLRAVFSAMPNVQHMYCPGGPGRLLTRSDFEIPISTPGHPDQPFSEAD